MSSSLGKEQYIMALYLIHFQSCHIFAMILRDEALNSPAVVNWEMVRVATSSNQYE